MDANIRSKLSPTTAELLERIERHEAVADRPVRLLVQLSNPLTSETKQRLNDVGLTIQTEAGDVLTARALPHAVPSIVALSDVRYLEVAEKMFLED